MIRGTLIRYNPDCGFGFIQRDDREPKTSRGFIWLERSNVPSVGRRRTRRFADRDRCRSLQCGQAASALCSVDMMDSGMDERERQSSCQHENRCNEGG
jgi:hypothetical protein